MIALLRRDLRLAVRAGGGFGLGLAFFLIVIVLVPFGVLVLLVFLALEGTPGQNRFGPDPLTPGLA